MNNISRAREIADICRLLHESDNYTEEDYWISEVHETPSRGYGYSLVKGKKGHAVLNQNGDLISRPTGRLRTGMWSNSCSHVTGLSTLSSGNDSTRSFRKQVRGFGYTFRQYSTFHRVDYMHPTKGALSMVILPDKGATVDITVSVSHMKAWPSEERGKRYRVSATGRTVVVESSLSKTVMHVPKGTKYSSRTDGISVSITLTVTSDSEIVISGDGSIPGINDLDEAMAYNSTVKDHSILQTPDFRINKLFLWAKHDLLELFSDSNIGSGFYAGLPGFSWFFGRDGEWISQAATEVGMGDLSRQHLDLLWKYSRDGRIPHELPVQDGKEDYGFEIDGGEVQTRFLSIDSSPLWIMNSIHLSNWQETPYDNERVEKVRKFLEKCDTDGDGFLENSFENGLIGWVESWAKKRDGLCVDVNAQWIQAKRMVEIINGGNGNEWKANLGTYMNRFVEKNGERIVVHDSINGGSSNDIRTPMSLVPLTYFGDRMGEYGPGIIREFVRDDMLLPWGIRSLSDSHSMYDDGYHTGMVWPLMTGWFSLGSFMAGETDVGMKLLQTFSMLAFDSADPGRIGEVYSSSDMRGQGQFFQGWSSSLFISTIVEGMFNLTLDTMCDRRWQDRISPRIPEEWNGIRLLRVRKGSSYYNITAEPGSVRVEESDGVRVDYGSNWN